MIHGKFVIPPTLTDALDLHRADAAAQLRVALPGEIVSYDPVKRTAQITVGYNRVYNDGTVKQVNAPLVDVPVVTLRGGGAHLGLPIAAGDECLVIFADINIDAWHAAGGQQTPLDGRRHDLADGFALVGPSSRAKPLVTALLAGEGGLASSAVKVAIDPNTQKATIANGPLPANNLNGILQTFLAAVAASTVLDAPTKAAATTAAAQLATLLY